MKPLFIGFLYYLLFSFSALTQNDSVKVFLFPDYQEGMIIYKNGTKAKAKFNYNLFTEEMWFINQQQDEDVVMILDHLTEIGSLTIDDRRFVPVKNVFYECVTAGNGDFYVQRKAMKTSRGKNVGLGYSTSSASTNVGYFSPQAKILESTDLFEGREENVFFLKDSKGSFKKFDSAKLLGKIFKGHESEIESYAKAHFIDFTKQEDVSRIVKFAYERN